MLSVSQILYNFDRTIFFLIIEQISKIQKGEIMQYLLAQTEQGRALGISANMANRLV